jgi:hypothetical protein
MVVAGKMTMKSDKAKKRLVPVGRAKGRVKLAYLNRYGARARKRSYFTLPLFLSQKDESKGQGSATILAKRNRFL